MESEMENRSWNDVLKTLESIEKAADRFYDRLRGMSKIKKPFPIFQQEMMIILQAVGFNVLDAKTRNVGDGRIEFIVAWNGREYAAYVPIADSLKVSVSLKRVLLRYPPRK